VSSHLLTPTLSEGAKPIAIYSVRAAFFVAFLGGAGASILFTAINAQRLGRLSKDAWLLALGAVVIVGYSIAIGIALGDPSLLGTIGPFVASRSFVRFGGRALGLVLWGLAYAVHRPFHRAAEMMDLAPPKPWKPGIVCTIIGGGLQVALAAAARSMVQGS
jgi:hypothetical protein